MARNFLVRRHFKVIVFKGGRIVQKFRCVEILVGILFLGIAEAFAVEVPTAEWERMKQRMAEMEARGAGTPPSSTLVDTALESKYGPNAAATTKVGGLIQVWYYNVQHDSRGFFDDPNVNHISDSNAVLASSGFRVRRSEIKLTMDLNENIRSVLMIDPARECIAFPGFPSNQADLFGTKKANQVAPGFKTNGVDSTAFITGGESGTTFSGGPRLLQDAFINWHDCLPHHDVQIGQFLVQLGEEGLRLNGELDFVERSMLGSFSNTRDMGAMVHGSWWEEEGMHGNGRFQYSLAVFNGAGTYFEPGNQQNRPESNYSKDINGRLLVRPLWDDCWGKMELGASVVAGAHGKGNNDLPITAPTNDLNRPQAWASHYNAWGSYKFGSVASGLWLRTEWTWIKDREQPGSVIDVQGNSTGTNKYAQQYGVPFSRQGIYGALGYKFSESKICELPCWLKPVEVLGRFEEFQNIETADLIEPWKTDAFYTRVWTAGVNYYIMGHNAKVQANYNFVELPGDKSSANSVFHDTKNNSFVLNFQVAF